MMSRLSGITYPPIHRTRVEPVPGFSVHLPTFHLQGSTEAPLLDTIYAHLLQMLLLTQCIRLRGGVLNRKTHGLRLWSFASNYTKVLLWIRGLSQRHRFERHSTFCRCVYDVSETVKKECHVLIPNPLGMLGRNILEQFQNQFCRDLSSQQGLALIH